MMLTLLAMPNPVALEAAGATRQVVARLTRAWVLTFAASQVTAPWRAAGAVALTPFVNRLLRFYKARLAFMGLKRAWMPPALYAASLAVGFGSALFCLGARELALVALTLR
mmetsp:Transcript_4103/g.6703  ORF Transcript_4103/g.6703 Transcript_4103/m.6703 type:complete len:111 (-) Transcript_4103:94-426(-)